MKRNKKEMRRQSPAATKGAGEGQFFPKPGRTPLEDTAAVMKFYKLPKSFSKAVLADARRCSAESATAAELGNPKRLDLRRKFIFTCDPRTAKDFDDALSIETDRRGNCVLGVHIADVSHYVKPGSAIDREAYRRSTSVYLCDKVVPMLPEELCNGVCSLLPGVDRLAFSVFMTFDRAGRMLSRSFAKSVIRSKARFTYEQVMAIISAGKAGRRAATGKAAALKRREVDAVLSIAALARTLRRRRFDAGALDIEVPEAEIVLDDWGELESIVARPYDESHQMVEECMVAANEAVAAELLSRGIKILSRLHEPPDEEKVELLAAELGSIGVKAGDLSGRKGFSHFLESVKGHPLYSTIAMMVLRSMKRAVYDSRSTGHFGLAKKFYAHFTSPIRRYPDLTLHRQLSAYLEGGCARVNPRILESWAKHTSEAEERATEAERALVEMKKYRFLEKEMTSRTTAVKEGVIVKCMPFGCFVELPGIAISGLVHVSDLSRRFVKFDAANHVLYEPHGRRWKIGDRMRVRIARVDIDAHKIDFTPAAT